MKGAKIGLGAIAIVIALFVPIRAKAQALPELPAETLATLELVQGQLQNTMLNANGLQVYQDASTSNLGSLLFLFEGLYALNNAYNDFQKGVTNGFQIIKAEEVQESDLPEGLEALEQAGATYSWDLEYFGHRVTMLTGADGKIRSFEDGKKALNVTAKNEMQTAIDQLKVQAQDRKHVPLPHGNAQFHSETYPTYGELKPPVINGTTLTFYVYNGSTEMRVDIENFENCVLWYLRDETFNYGIIGIAGNTDNIVVKRDGIVRPRYNNEIYMSNVTSTIFGSMRGVSLYSGFPASNSVSFKMPCNHQYSFSTFQNRYNANSDASIQGMYNGQEIPLGNARQFYITVGAVQEIAGYPQTPSQLINQPISASSLQEIQNAIAEIEPEVDPETGIEILPIPQEFPLPEAVPLESTEPAPPIPPGIEDFPQSDPSQVPSQNPNVDPGTEPTNDPLPDSAEEIQPMEELQLVTGLQNRFPFSIPWDIYNAYKMLQAQREIPHWEWDMVVNLPGGGVFTHTFVLDLEFIDPVVSLFRDLFLLAFILGLAIYSYNKFFGGGA